MREEKCGSDITNSDTVTIHDTVRCRFNHYDRLGYCIGYMIETGMYICNLYVDFETGYIKWDDEDRNNGNSFSGVLPDGTYNQDTVVFFCCRDDGPSYNPITLPTDDTFILFPVEDKCQEVM